MSETIDLHVKAKFEVQHDSVRIDLLDGAVIFRTYGDLHLWLDTRPLCTTMAINLDLDEAHTVGEIIDCTLFEDKVVAEYEKAYENQLDGMLW